MHPRVLILLPASLLLASCTTLHNLPSSDAAFAVVAAAQGQAEVVDLTQTLDEQTSYYPSPLPEIGTGNVPVVKNIPVGVNWSLFPAGMPFSREPGRGGNEVPSFCTGEHTGTHMDAPNHFHPLGADAADSRPADLIRPLVVIDVREEARDNPDLGVDAAHLRRWEEQHGTIPEGSIVALHTGHTAHADTLVVHHPGYTLDAAEFLRSERNVAGVGTDALSPELPNLAFPVHKRLLQDECHIVENLRHLDRVPAQGAYIFAAPLPVDEASGSQARVLAVLDPPRDGTWGVLDLTHKLDKKVPCLPGRDRLYSDLDLPVIEEISPLDLQLNLLPHVDPIDREMTAKVMYHGYHSGRYCLGEMTGSHLVFPRRSSAAGLDAASFPVDRLIAPAVVVDLSPVQDGDTVDEPRLRELLQGASLRGAVLILATGRDSVGSRQGRLTPGLSATAATAVMRQGALGIISDGHGIDSLTVTGRPAEEAVHAAGGFTGGFVKEPGRLPAQGAIVALMCLPIGDGLGAPARMIAFVPVY